MLSLLVYVQSRGIDKCVCLVLNMFGRQADVAIYAMTHTTCMGDVFFPRIRVPKIVPCVQ